MYNRRLGRIIFNSLLVLAFALLAYSPGLAQGPGPSEKFKAAPLTPESTFQGSAEKRVPSLKVVGAGSKLTSVIVKLRDEPLATYSGNVPGLAPTNPKITGAPRLDPASNNSRAYLQYLDKQLSTFEATASRTLPKGRVTHRFDVILAGVAMLVPADQVDAVAKLPNVQAVYPDELLHLDTDNSPQFIGAPTVWNQLGGQEKAGEGVVVGVLDTGIWPEHPSFSDPDPSGKPYSPPPPPLSGTRACDFAGGANPGPTFTCNNKLIGARRFMSTYEAVIGLLPGEYTSARDDDGHGTHTSSTAAGNAGVQASIFGISRGTISGIAPRAHVIMYKVCGAEGCFGSDSAAAVEQAILDGVNVINFSIGGGANPFADAVELAFLDAYEAGVFVAASAGNAGPDLDTTDHRGPWVTTVAASTQNRAFQTTATVTAGSANLSLTGASLTLGVTTPTPVVVAGDAPYSDPFCLNDSYAPSTFSGKVVVCERGGDTAGRAAKGYRVSQGGAAGMILYNQSASVTDLETDNHFLPAVHIQFSQGQALLSFLTAHPGATVTWPVGAKASVQGDVMASFSSRGGPGQSLGVSKPDITAPGVQILAGHSPQHLPPPDGVALGPQGELFQAIAGTSMSSPHIAGSGALLKALHPDWTPGQIKSALMTTAKTAGVVKEDGTTPADAFDDGSGRVDLSKAGNPGLTFDETAANYVALQDQLWNANYPSLYVPVMPGIVTVKRTVHSELKTPSCWVTSVSSPSDVHVFVPPVFCVSRGGNQTFSITVDGHSVPLGETRFATLKFKFGTYELHFPITFVRQQPVVTLTKACDPATFARGSTTNCTLTIQNTSFDTATVNLVDPLPRELNLVRGSVSGATALGDFVFFKGALHGAEPPDVTMATGSSPAGVYLPLSIFPTVPPVAGVGDETIANFNVPAFQYAGETYTRIGIVSNGYLVVGGGTGADVDFINQRLPNSTPPNNVLAPFWTDLNPGASGTMRVAELTDGVNSWLVFDWESVPNYGTAATNSFEVWVGINGVQDISFSYGPDLTAGTSGALTVGAENRYGNRGANYYYSDGTNSVGTLPAANFDAVVVNSVPGAPGETHVITFGAKGVAKGKWTNCAAMTGNIFFGTNTACFSGEVTK